MGKTPSGRFSVVVGEQVISFALRGPPVAWHRPQQSRSNRIDGRGVRVYKAKRDVDYQKAIAIEATAAMMRWRHVNDRPWSGEGEWHLEVVWFLPDLVRRDIDNLEKNLLDALSGVCFDDDKQVVSVSKAKRIDRDNPRTEVIVRRVSGYLSE